MNHLLARQLRKATREGPDGGLDLDRLLRLVSDHYDAIAREHGRATHALRAVGGRVRDLNSRAQGEAAARELLDNVAEALLAVDTSGEIAFCNAQAHALFAGGRRDPDPAHISALFALPEASATETMLRDWAAAHSATGAASEVCAIKLDGRRFPAAVNVRATRLGGQRGYMLSVRDITRRKAREEQLELDARFERLVSEICGCFVAAPPDYADAAIVDALEMICRFTGAAASRVFQFSSDSADRSDLSECTHQSDSAQQRERILLDTELPWLAGHIRQLRGIDLTVVSRLPAEAERERRWFAATGAHAFALAPLCAGSSPLGFLLLQFQQPGVRAPRALSERLRLLADVFVAELRRSSAAAHEARLMGVLDATPDLVALTDRAGELLHLNAKGRALLGLDRDASLRGRAFTDFLPEEDAIAFTRTGIPGAISAGLWRATVRIGAAGSPANTVAQTTMAHRGAGGEVEFLSITARDVSEEREAALRVADSEARLRLALNAARMLGWDWDIPTGRLQWTQDADPCRGWFGRSDAPASLEAFLHHVHAGDRPAVSSAIARAFAGSGHDFRSEYRLVDAEGRVRWVDMRGSVARDRHGRAARMTGTLCDITERHAATTALSEERERALVTLQSIADGVITTDEHGLVETLNPVALQRLGVGSSEVAGRLIDELFMPIDTERTRGEHPVLRCLREGRTIESAGAALAAGPGGEKFALRFSAAPIRAADGRVRGAVVVFQDVNQERSLYQRLSYQARHDALTGLVNRRELEQELSERLSESWRDESAEHALLYLDIDQFKVINDTSGHAAGDELLRRVADVVREQVRAGDCLARLGGDEFCILLAQCAPERSRDIAEAIRARIAALRFVWQERTYSVSASIGIVAMDAHSDSVASVLSAADVACHTAKVTGRNRVSSYCAAEPMVQHREMQWVSRITQACEDDRLTLFYHPIVPASNTGERRHFEMLLRMRDSYGTLIPPNAFIPAAERYNLMPMVDRWVVRRVLADLAQADGRELRYTLAINLSGSSLSDPHFLEFLRTELTQRNVCPGALCFEITETAAISNLDQVVRFMDEIRSLGCKFALDDFGSGLSSFAYLKDLPVDYLKIDRLFVRNIASDIVDHSMVAAINQVGQVMGLRTVAEGVESESVLEKVHGAGIDYVQGFLFGRPAEVTDAGIFEPRESAQIIPLAGQV